MFSSKWFFNENRWSAVNTKSLHMQNCPQTLNLAFCVFERKADLTWVHIVTIEYFFPLPLSFSKVDAQAHLRHH